VEEFIMTRLPGYKLLEPHSIAFRAVCLGALLQKDHLLAASNHIDKQKSGPKVNRLDREESQRMITFALSKNLRNFLFRPKNYGTHDPVATRRWAVDELAVQLWSLGVIEKKPLVEVSFTIDELCAKIPFSGNLVKFVNKARLRSIAELYPLEVALDVYSYRATLILGDFDFDGNMKDRILKKAKDLFDSGYLVSAPTDDLVLHDQRMQDVDLFELEQIGELTSCRTNSLFYVFGKMGR